MVNQPVIASESPDAPPPPVPADVAARIVRAIDQSPSTIVVLLDHDLRIEWISQSALWTTGSDPGARVGSSAMERIHPADVGRLLEGIQQLAAGGGSQAAVAAQRIRYRFQRSDGRWVLMEATVHNHLDDPLVDGMLLFTRPAGDPAGDVRHVIDLMRAEMPLTDVLAACAELVPEYIGSGAVVAFIEGERIVGAPLGGPAQRLMADPRWWESAARRGESLWPADFSGIGEGLAETARREGFGTAWTSLIRDSPTGEMIGFLMIWALPGVERNVATDEALARPNLMASMVIADELRRRSIADWSRLTWPRR